MQSKPPRRQWPVPPERRIRKAIASAVLPLLAIVSAADEPEPDSGDAGARAEEWFGDEGLGGFVAWMPGLSEEEIGRIFSAGDGVLRISGEGFGYLRTRDSYRDFVLSAEFRWGGGGHPSRTGKARDSGIFIHAKGPDGNSHDGDGAFMAGIECNLFEGACGDVLLIRGDDTAGELIAPRVEFEASEASDGDGFFWWEAGGPARSLEVWGRVNRLGKSRVWRDIRGFREAGSLEKPPGEWNAIQIESRCGEVAIRLNGVPVNRVRRVSPFGGHVLFQCEGSEIHFRRVRMAAIPSGRDDPEAPEAGR